MRRALALLALAGCGHLGLGHPAPEPAADVRIVLYRDRALVEEELVAPVRDGHAVLPWPLGVATAEVQVTSDDVHPVAWAVADPEGQREVAAVGGARAVEGRLLGIGDGSAALASDGAVTIVEHAELLRGRGRPALAVAVEGRDGPARFRLRYPTTGLGWQAAYTVIGDGTRARLQAALVVDNRTGRQWRQAALAVIDGDAPDPADGPRDAPPLVALPGRYPLGPGVQRLALALPARSLAMRSRLVYDPVGTDLDRGSLPPVLDAAYGVRPWSSTVAEAVEVELGALAPGALPAGPVRLAEVGADGGLAWRGEGRLLPPVAGGGPRATIDIGQVGDVTGRRRRTDLVLDAGHQHLFEEITVTLTSARSRPVDVVVREHLYRGPCWIIAYHSNGERAAAEGSQQIALTATVPPGGTATVVYRVIYRWSAAECSG